MTSLFILGSGFSKAVNDSMPTVIGLSKAAEAFLEEERATPLLRPSDFDDFEVWLSYLSVEQPALMSYENLENRALFYRISSWLGSHLSRQQRLPDAQQPRMMTTLKATTRYRPLYVYTLTAEGRVLSVMPPARLIMASAISPACKATARTSPASSDGRSPKSARSALTTRARCRPAKPVANGTFVARPARAPGPAPRGATVPSGSSGEVVPGVTRPLVGKPPKAARQSYEPCPRRLVWRSPASRHLASFSTKRRSRRDRRARSV